MDFLTDEFALENYLALRTKFLKGTEAIEFIRQMMSVIPKVFKYKHFLSVSDYWNCDKDIAKVREWLFQLKIPFDQDIYMLYDENVMNLYSMEII